MLECTYSEKMSYLPPKNHTSRQHKFRVLRPFSAQSVFHHLTPPQPEEYTWQATDNIRASYIEHVTAA